MNKILFFIFLLQPILIQAQTDSVTTERQLREVSIKVKNEGKLGYRTENIERIGASQLIRAACCNLGESFVASPSVDVNYSDAATGARQIKLLGLSGTYVQMLTENVPNMRGAAIPFSLGYTPGPWMHSIQVSKGASSVKNGYESTTGQINIEYLKPQATDGVRGNAYLDSKLKFEGNADASIHLNERLSASILLHFENRQTEHDNNNDGFMDMPRVRQYNIMHRWAYVSPKFISQIYFRFLQDERHSGQCNHAKTTPETQLWYADVNTKRYELQWKNGITINPSRNESIALMLHGSIHDAKNRFTHRYDITQTNGYAQFMYERDLGKKHNIATGASLNFDRYNELSDNNICTINSETTPGIYAQYTYKLDDKFTAMVGMRYDHSSLWGGNVTPRLHLKYAPSDIISFRGSVGKGSRTSHAWAENVSLMASGRQFVFNNESNKGLGIFREEAWNYGISASMNIPVGEKNLELNAEYYYTDFNKQMVVNVDPEAWTNPTGFVPTFYFSQLKGRSYSHTIQIDATYPFFEGFTATGAFRYNDARTTYEHIGLKQRPLTSKYKALITLSYKTPLELWQFDVTGHLIGPGHLYYQPTSENSTYPAYLQLQAQVTREFRNFTLYAGGENLTNYKIHNPIINSHNPWSQKFDATQVWGPVEGAMFYIGVRFKFNKII